MPIVPPVLWLGAGLLLMLGELVAPGAFLVWIGLAAFGTGIAVLLGLGGFEAEVACFVVLAALAIGTALKLHRRALRPSVNTPGSGLVGRTATALAFTGLEGRVRVGDSDWPARLAGAPGGAAIGRAVAPGTRLKVQGIDGLVLLVVPEGGG